MELKKKAIDRMRYKGDGKSRDVRWDDKLKGFGVRIFKSGAKSFVLSYRFKGRKRLMNIGKYGKWTLDKARKEAKSLLVDVDKGKDPLQEKQKERKGQKIPALCTAFLDRHAKVEKKTWRTDEARINKYILPGWKGFQIAAVSRDDVKALHDKITQRAPIEANRVIALASKMFNLAADPEWGFVEEDHKNPCRGITMNKEKSREVWVQPPEFPKLAEAIDKEPNIYIRAVLWAYLLTGARKSELLRAKIVDIDHYMKKLRLEDTKAGKPQTISLNEPAYVLLSELPAISGNPYLFPGRNPG